jgi:hypothetical protein
VCVCVCLYAYVCMCVRSLELHSVKYPCMGTANTSPVYVVNIGYVIENMFNQYNHWKYAIAELVHFCE